MSTQSQKFLAELDRRDAINNMPKKKDAFVPREPTHFTRKQLEECEGQINPNIDYSQKAPRFVNIDGNNVFVRGEVYEALLRNQTGKQNTKTQKKEPDVQYHVKAPEKSSKSRIQPKTFTRKQVAECESIIELDENSQKAPRFIKVDGEYEWVRGEVYEALQSQTYDTNLTKEANETPSSGIMTRSAYRQAQKNLFESKDASSSKNKSAYDFDDATSNENKEENAQKFKNKNAYDSLKPVPQTNDKHKQFSKKASAYDFDDATTSEKEQKNVTQSQNSKKKTAYDSLKPVPKTSDKQKQFSKKKSTHVFDEDDEPKPVEKTAYDILRSLPSDSEYSDDE